MNTCKCVLPCIKEPCDNTGLNILSYIAHLLTAPSESTRVPAHADGATHSLRSHVLASDGALDLSARKINDAGAAEIGAALAEKSRLTALDVSTNEIGPAGAASLLKTLGSGGAVSASSASSSLTSAGSSGAGSGAGAGSGGMSSPPSMKRASSLAASGGATIMSGLTALSMRDNPLGADGAHVLATVLKSVAATNASGANCLRSLDVQGCSIGDAGTGFNDQHRDEPIIVGGQSFPPEKKLEFRSTPTALSKKKCEKPASVSQLYHFAHFRLLA
jgi:hypothetical protein